MRRIALSTGLSIGIHATVIAALHYVTLSDSAKIPSQKEQVINISLVNLETFAPVPQPKTQPQPQPQPQPKSTAVVQPRLPLAPKLKPVKTIEKHQPKLETKSKFRPRPRPIDHTQHVVKSQASPFSASTEKAPVLPALKPTTTPASHSNTPRPLDRIKPQYPTRAFALRIEGQVNVQFDVASDGRVGNIRILSAQPRNMFEREVTVAMSQWRYEPKQAKNLTVTLIFKINGGGIVER